MGDGIRDFQGLIDKVCLDVADRVVCDNYLSQEEGISEEEREQRIKEYMSLHCVMDKCLYLCGETILECPEGFNKIILKSVDHNVYVDGQPVRASTDCAANESAHPFGVCYKQSREEKKAVICEPKFAYDKWLESCSKMKVGDADSVNENSYLICLSGGGIKVTPVLTTSGIKEGLEIDTDIETQIQNIINLIKGEELKRDNNIYSYDEMMALTSVEILARMIYQEDHSPDYGCQNAIVFSVVNRLYAGNWLNKGADNNLYGILAANGQYESLLDVKRASKQTDMGIHNAYWPPSDDNAPENEKAGWENAKRLAAITCLAVELYGEGEETIKGGTVKTKDNNVRDNIIKFIEEQEDYSGKKIENIIGSCQSFKATPDNLVNPIILKNEKGVSVGNAFYRPIEGL